MEMNNRDVGRQRKDRILVAEEDVPHESKSVTSSSLFQLTSGLGLLKITS
jgi:hypothetical protein